MYVFSIFFKTIVSISINVPYNVFVKINKFKPKVKHPKKLTYIPFLQVQNQPFQARYVLPRFANISIKFQTLGEKKFFFQTFFYLNRTKLQTLLYFYTIRLHDTVEPPPFNNRSNRLSPNILQAIKSLSRVQIATYHLLRYQKSGERKK